MFSTRARLGSAPWQAALWCAALLWLQGCKIEPVDKSTEAPCVGPNCFTQDAAPPAPPGAADASTSVVPAPVYSADAGAELCPGDCVPDLGVCSLNAGAPLQLNFAPQQALTLPGIAQLLDAGSVGAASDAGVIDGWVRDGGSTDASLTEDSGEAWDAASPPPPANSDDGSDFEADSGAGGSGYVATVPDQLTPVDIDSGPTTEEPEPSGQACQLVPRGAQVYASCEASGAGEKDSACNSSADCRPGLGCVTDLSNIGGTCLPYCCGGDSACEVGFCGRRPLKTTEVQEAPPLVPVCVPSEQCDLMDPYPCPAGSNCKCPEGSACSPVGKDGARHCVPPGGGTEGDSCPCAAGYFCSAQQQCLKLCQLGSDMCQTGSCMAAGGFPEQWGLCLNASRAAAAP